MSNYKYFIIVSKGDQVLEWNGIPLTGKSYEQVQTIIDETPCVNGELELVIKQLVVTQS